MQNRSKSESASHGKFYKNTIWQYGLQVLKYIFPLILVPYLTRVLGTDSYAVYAYVLSFMGVMQSIADFGFTLSGTKKVVDNKNDQSYISVLVGNITVARLILLATLLAATLVVSFFIPILSENLLYVLLAFVAVGLRALLPDFVFQGYEMMGPLTTRYFASKGAQLVLTLLLVRSPNDLLLVVFADIVGSSIGIVWSYVATSNLFIVHIQFGTMRQSLIELKDSAIYCVSNVSSSLFSGFTTIIVGLALPNNADIAYWSLALTTVNAVQALYTPIANSLYPHMLNNGDFRFAKKIALLALPALAVGTGAYCLLSKQIMLVLGGQDYIDAAGVMLMLAPVLPLSFYSVLLGWPVLGAKGYVRELTETTVVAGLFNVITLLALFFLGLATLASICLVRCLVEAVLLSLRVIFLWRLTIENAKTSKN